MQIKSVMQNFFKTRIIKDNNNQVYHDRINVFQLSKYLNNYFRTPPFSEGEKCNESICCGLKPISNDYQEPQNPALDICVLHF